MPCHPLPVTAAEAGRRPGVLALVAASVVEECGPDEWTFCIEVPETARLANGTPAPADTPDDDTYFPIVFHDASEIRLPDPTAEPAADAVEDGATP